MIAGGRRNLIFRTAPLRQAIDMAIVMANDDDRARPIGTGRLVAVETEVLTTGQNFDSWRKDPQGSLNDPPDRRMSVCAMTWEISVSPQPGQYSPVPRRTARSASGEAPNGPELSCG